MFIGAADRPATDVEDLELRRDRLQELITLKLVSPTLLHQLQQAVSELDRRIADARPMLLRAAA